MGEQNTYGFEVHGERGALAWDFRRMGELRVALDQDYQNAAYATRHVGPGDGEFGAFQPGAGIALSFDDLKVIELHRLVQSIATGQPTGPRSRTRSAPPTRRRHGGLRRAAGLGQRLTGCFHGITL